MQYRTMLQFFLIMLLPFSMTLFFDGKTGWALTLLLQAATLWFTAVIPLPVTGLLVPVLGVMYQLVDTGTAFSAFGNQILFLFLGSFFLAKAMQVHRLDQRIAYFVLSKPVSGSTVTKLIVSVSLLCWVFSMWISNTAATVIVTPICLGIVASLRSLFSSEKAVQNFAARILLVCAFASSMGGMATPVGSPPNLIAMEFLATQNHEIGFLHWILYALPVSAVMLIVVNFILAFWLPVENVSLGDTRRKLHDELQTLGRFSQAELAVLLCFLLAVVLWLTPGFAGILAPDATATKMLGDMLPMGVVGLLCGCLLFILPANQKGEPCLHWQDAVKVDWGTILIFGGGLCLGKILDSSGLAAMLGGFLFSTFAGNWVLLGLSAVVIGILLSEFSSNTASASILIPILLGTSGSMSPPVILCVVIAATLGASCGFMLPVSTPPNAIVYGTNQVPIRTMIRSGMMIDVSAVIVIGVLILGLLPFFIR